MFLQHSLTVLRCFKLRGQVWGLLVHMHMLLCLYIFQRSVFTVHSGDKKSSQVSVYLLLKAYSDVGDIINGQLLECSFSPEQNIGLDCLLLYFSFCMSRAYISNIIAIYMSFIVISDN